MWSVRILDRDHPIIELVWSGKVEPSEFEAANKKIAECIKEVWANGFDMLVDTSNLVSFGPEAQRLVVEQQKWVISQGLRRSAVVTPGAVVNITLDMIRSKSGHSEEYKFPTREQALAFLKGKLE
ncbi:MAG: STAS/SEC14 domain-containing protein [Firmicutes bacterium]|nr:STAS/SEC14 domain-containing protein [Bacillota bacterium]